jgi:methylmalonyl-CoA/ethylmalonyl-CoA epimerase
MYKRPYGPIVQTAFVVTDIDEGIAYWTQSMRVGPFFKFPKIVYAESDYRGMSCPIETDVALAYSGELMIELVKPLGPSIFAEFLEQGHVGVQHFAALTADMGAARADIERRGGTRIQGGSVAEGSSVAYFEIPGLHPAVLEIACLHPPILNLFDAIKSACAAWDGETPILHL